jgi:outer membrane murein-binding lipoprotein Lpp
MRTASSILALAASALLSLPLAGCASWSTFPRQNKLLSTD